MLWSLDVSDTSSFMEPRLFGGLAAQCIQHEVEHLDGITLAQHWRPMKRARMLERVAGRQAG